MPEDQTIHERAKEVINRYFAKIASTRSQSKIKY
ncbi:MAG: hypothetical protein IRD7MM_00445 [Candidatus Midichloria mitochondrii]